MSSRRIAIALVMALLFAARARAGIVFEYHPHERPIEIEAAMTQLLDELEQGGRFVARPAAVRAALGVYAPAPALSDRNLTAADLLAHVTIGYKAYLDGRYDQAILQLAAAIAEGHANPALLVAASKYRLAMLDALAGLAASYHRRNRAGDRAQSIAVMQELIRSFPDRLAALRDAYGPELDGIYKAARARLQARGTGSLIIDVDHEDALIFINEVDPPQNAAFKANLPPGLYRVVVKTPSSNGRRYVLEVKPNETTRLSVPWALATSLATSDRWVGFANVSEDVAVAHARRLAEQLAHVMFVVVTRTTSPRGPSLKATVYRTRDGKQLRSHEAFLDGEATARVSALARVLRAEVQLGEPLVTTASRPARDRSPPPTGPRRTGTRWFAGGAVLGGGGLLAGGLAIASVVGADRADRELRSACAVSCPSEVALALERKRDAAQQRALVAGVAGGVALAGGLVLALIGRSRRGAGLAIAPRGSGVLVGYAAAF